MPESRGKTNPCPECGESRVSIEAKCIKCGWLPEQRPSIERRYIPPNTSVATILSFVLLLFVVAFVALPFIDPSIVEGAGEELAYGYAMLFIVPPTICLSVILAYYGCKRAKTPFAVFVVLIATVSPLAVVVMLLMQRQVW